MILINCSTVQKLMQDVDKYLTTPVKVIAIVLFLVFTSLEYAKVVFSADGSFKKANQSAIKRLLGMLLLFFAPNIINLILSWIEIGTCKI